MIIISLGLLELHSRSPSFEHSSIMYAETAWALAPSSLLTQHKRGERQGAALKRMCELRYISVVIIIPTLDVDAGMHNRCKRIVGGPVGVPSTHTWLPWLRAWTVHLVHGFGIELLEEAPEPRHRWLDEPEIASVNFELVLPRFGFGSVQQRHG